MPTYCSDVRSVVIFPLSTATTGNGTAQRCDRWRRALATLGPSIAVIAQVSSSTPPSNGEELAQIGGAHGLVGSIESELDFPGGLPYLATKASASDGARWVAQRGGLDGVDVVVVVRSYMVPFALGVVAQLTPRPRLIVDLDDDEVAFADSAGDVQSAIAYRLLNTVIRRHADMVVAAQPLPHTPAIPNGVVVPDVAARVPDPHRPRLVMVGNFHYGPNVDGAHWLAEQVMPKVVADAPNAKLVLAGHGSADRRWPHPGHVEALGYVGALGALYASATAAVVPLWRGSGTRIKILEAWAHRVPVVSTTIGADGLGTRCGHDLLIGDNPDQFSDQLKRILVDDDLADRLVAHGRSRVLSEFADHHLINRIRTLLAEVCEGGG